ncbi:hypothetical protein KP509_06G001600 [Ceratopteris richardii]|uniref:Uncharacterized protein n=1 Tax=Ceratopteris richardii TaxID=49495 RepID=A0A8T2UKX8_CERRI|nr:hypothetical protein KP509_06G001600 [Ceratopteris richardii]
MAFFSLEKCVNERSSIVGRSRRKENSGSQRIAEISRRSPRGKGRYRQPLQKRARIRIFKRVANATFCLIFFFFFWGSIRLPDVTTTARSQEACCWHLWEYSQLRTR